MNWELRYLKSPTLFFDSDKFTAGVSMTRFGFDRRYTIIYHRDMEKPDWLYGKLLGLEREPESHWGNLYNVAENMRIGVAQEGRGYIKTTEDKQVNLCLGAQRVQWTLSSDDGAGRVDYSSIPSISIMKANSNTRSLR
jgi:hypothetical protein